jgi:uncharacterized protein HemY
MLREALGVAELAETFVFGGVQRLAKASLLSALVSRGDYEAARQLVAEIRTLYGDEFPEGSLAIARLHLGLGEADRALREATALVERNALLDFPSFEVPALITRALARLRARGVPARAEAEADFARTAHLIDGFALERHRPSLHEARAELARLLGDEAGHARELREAQRLYAAMGADGHVQRLATELES